MMWVAYFCGVMTVPVLAVIAVLVVVIATPSRQWTGCAQCAFWTTSLYPIPRWLQWVRHRTWARFRPEAHRAYGAGHPPRREPFDPVPTDLLLGERR